MWFEEYKVVLDAYDASYGHSGGSAIDVSLKSGTNKIHGSADYFMRGDRSTRKISNPTTTTIRNARPHEHVAKVRARIQAQPSNLDLSVRPFDFGERGRRGEDRFLFVAQNRDMQLLIGGSRYHFLELRETLNGIAVHRLHHIAREKTRRGARPARLDGGNSRRHDHLSVNQHGLPEISVYSRENPDGEQEIEQRAGENGRGALPDRLREEGHGALGFGHLRQRRQVDPARGVGVSVEFNIAAERDRRDAPACSFSVVKGAKLWSEAEQKASTLMPHHRPTMK